MKLIALSTLFTILSFYANAQSKGSILQWRLETLHQFDFKKNSRIPMFITGVKFRTTFHKNWGVRTSVELYDTEKYKDKKRIQTLSSTAISLGLERVLWRKKQFIMYSALQGSYLNQDQINYRDDQGFTLKEKVNQEFIRTSLLTGFDYYLSQTLYIGLEYGGEVYAKIKSPSDPEGENLAFEAQSLNLRLGIYFQ
ncbi:hypothetical protein [Sediminitomix flava]|uniref:Outer membrane protein with beta-barrel domain n=1 Tax=Sediminitomix flava TaxID=379075 RepID=A0A315ZAM7_SEDFL|nr:hypothetical protein [Sediminitomix flava]PWJ42646.1 hypothetical protein BC781_102190 [Sediminitomix flava]